MTILNIRSLACVTLGSLVGLLGATWKTPPTLKAHAVVVPVVESPATPSPATCTNGEPSECCYPGMNKTDLPGDASSKTGR